MTVWIAAECPDCHSTELIKHGKSPEDKQRFLCQNPDCLPRTFILDYTYPRRTRLIKQQMVEMSMNSSGIRDIARVLKVGAPTVIRELKKMSPYLSSINQKALENLKLEQVEGEIYKVKEAEGAANPGVEESELDEMWSGRI